MKPGELERIPHAGLRRKMELRARGLCVSCATGKLFTKDLCKPCRNTQNLKRTEQYKASKKMLEGRQ